MKFLQVLALFALIAAVACMPPPRRLRIYSNRPEAVRAVQKAPTGQETSLPVYQNAQTVEESEEESAEKDATELSNSSKESEEDAYNEEEQVDKEAEEKLRREKEAEDAAKNAHYSFKTNVDDQIMDSFQHREEVRDGLKVKGMYTSSDGFFKRVTYYEADERGYRVVKEEVEAIGDGPRENVKGSAKVDTAVNGFESHYVVDGKDIARLDTRKSLKQSLL